MTSTDLPDATTIAYVAVDAIPPHPSNPKSHDLTGLVASIRRLGFAEPIVIDQRTGLNVSGHGRVEALALLAARVDAGETDDQGQPYTLPSGVVVAEDGQWLAPVYIGWSSTDDLEAEAALIALNRIGERGGWHDAPLLAVLERLEDLDAGLDSIGYDDRDLMDLRERLSELEDSPAETARATLAERFGVAPLSVLDSRSGTWQERKRAWLGLGIRSEVGRGTQIGGLVQGGEGGSWADKITAEKGQESLDAIRSTGSNGGLAIESVSGADPAFYAKKRRAEKLLGRELDTADFVAHYYVAPDGPANLSSTGTSVFDPVLCEVAYRWFLPPVGGTVLDPFSGGSVRGIVAAWLGHRYVGVDLRAEQTEANAVQATEILDDDQPVPTWHVGDATALDAALPDDLDLVDLIFSCPPYYDLERYSDDPADLSNLSTYDEFDKLHAAAIGQAVDRLADDRFAVWVVGEVRGKDGRYHGLIPDTVAAFAAAGCVLYNEAILITPAGSVPVRAGRQMDAGRKLGKTHQNVLVFYKGNPKGAARGWGPPSGVELPTTDDPLGGDDLTVHDPT